MFRHAVRTLARNRGATLVVVLTLAVAIAATTVIYSATAVATAIGLGLSVPGVDPRDPSNYAAVALTIALRQA